MKKYILLTRSISSMGGIEIYVNAKVEYLKERNYEVFVLSYTQGIPLTKNLYSTKTKVNEILKIYPYVLTESKRKNVFNEIFSDLLIGSEEEIIIESTAPELGLWGEYFAGLLSAKHIVFLMDEDYSFNKILYEFIQFKQHRKELFFNDIRFFKLLLPECSINDAIIHHPICSEVVSKTENEEVFNEIYNLKCDYLCCSLGRLEKLHIKNTVDSFYKFAIDNPKLKLCYLFIGDQVTNSEVDIQKEIENKFCGIENVELKMYKGIFPLPKKIFSYIDLGVATAGCANVLQNNDVITVSMDCNDGHAIGVLRYDTSNSLKRTNEDVEDLYKYMTNVLIKKIITKADLRPIKNKLDIEAEFDKYMESVKLSEEVHDYYVFNDKHSSLIKTAIVKLLGPKGYLEIRKKLKKDNGV